MKRIFAALVIFAVCAFAAKAYNGQSHGGRVHEILRHNINQVEMCVSNYGKFGQDETGNNAGLWWPVGEVQHNYIYGAGFWFGTVDAAGDSLVTIGYGPHGGESEPAPGRAGWTVSDPDAIIWMQGTANWPPNLATLPMAPTTNLSHQDSWCVYNDLDPQYHMAGDTRPIGIEIYQTVYAWNLSTTEDIIFVRFEVKNVSGDSLRACYFGVCADNDIGNESGTSANDRISGIVSQEFVIGTDTFLVDDLGYQWQEEEEPGSPAWWAGAIGFDYLQSPYRLEAGFDRDNDTIPDQYEQDSAYYVNNWPSYKWDVDLDGTPDWRDPSQNPQWGMTAFKRFTLQVEPNFDFERYTCLAGYNFRTGVYEPYDTVPPDPDDQRFVQCSGPFDMGEDETAVVLIGIVLAEWHNIFNRPDSALVEVDATAQFIYDQNWLLPGPPPAPNLILQPGDTRITLIWDDLAETTPDPYYYVVSTAPPASPLYDPYYLEYDFQGYRVWRSPSGQAGSWELLTYCDLADGITFEDTTFEDTLRAEDTGVFHTFTDEDVRNGFPVYYAVSSFDYNYVKTIEGSDTFPTPIWFESGRTGDSTQARRDPANYIAPGEPVIGHVSGNDQITALVSATVVYGQEIDENRPLYIEYLAPDTATAFFTDTNFVEYPYTAGRYTALLKDDNGVLDTISYVVPIGAGYVPHEVVPPVNGMFLNPDIGTPELPSPFTVYDSLGIVSGTYPLNFLVTSVSVPLPAAEDSSDTVYMHGMWAWRGNNYQVVWHPKTAGGIVNTVDVTDLVTGEVIPYQPYQNTPSTRHLGAGWCFTWHTPSSAWTKPSHDTVQVGSNFTPATRTRYLYINGGMIGLRNNSYMYDTILPEDGETWFLSANREYLPASVYGEVMITCTPAMFLVDTTLDLNVKVVPNPYIVSNEWQTQFVQRRVKFINLPNECTIRIFNLNGELVRTLLHTETSEGGVGNDLGGDEWWDVLSDNRQLIASGVYIFHIRSDVGEQVGKFVIIQ